MFLQVCKNLLIESVISIRIGRSGGEFCSCSEVKAIGQAGERLQVELWCGGEGRGGRPQSSRNWWRKRLPG